MLQGARAHATLCHIADPLERDTSSIADSAAATGHCPACGAPVGPNSRFCPQCGAALAIAAPPADQATETPPPTDQPATAATGHCPACGAPVSPRSRFCPQCGAALAAAKSRKPAPPRRARRRRLPVLLGVLLLGLVAAGAVALWLRTTDEGETPTDLVRESTLEILGAPPGPGPSGLERHAPVRLSHPTGAELVVSPGEIFYSDYLDLRALPQPPAAPAWAFFGNAYTFVSVTGVVHPDPIEIRLPRAGATDGATIVALAPSGAWVPLPTTDEGSQLKATIQGIPAPWYVAVATPRPVTSPSSGDPSTDPEVEQLLELERLAYTDRAAWNDAALAWLEANPPEEVEEPLEGGARPSSATPALLAPQPTPWERFREFEKAYLAALTRLSAVGASHAHGDTSPVPSVAGSPASTFEQYRTGILELRKARDTWRGWRSLFAELFDNVEKDNFRAVLLKSGVPVQDSLETALATYAPWGIEITTELVRSGAIANLDLSVIYGEALFADVILPPGTLPSLESALKFDTRRTFDKPYPRNHGWAQDPETTLRLRLYSTAALEKWALLDYLKDWKTEAFLRYLPVALWALGVTSGGPGLVVASVADQVLSSWQSYYERQDFDPSTAALYGNIQWATTAVPGSQLFFFPALLRGIKRLYPRLLRRSVQPLGTQGQHRPVRLLRGYRLGCRRQRLVPHQGRPRHNREHARLLPQRRLRLVGRSTDPANPGHRHRSWPRRAPSRPLPVNPRPYGSLQPPVRRNVRAAQHILLRPARTVRRGPDGILGSLP